MAERKRFGIEFIVSYKEATGAVLYYLSVIKALNLLEDNRKPEIHVIYNEKAPLDDIKGINYPYIKFFLLGSDRKKPVPPALSLNILIRKINSLLFRIKNKIFELKTPQLYDYPVKLDAFYGIFISDLKLRTTSYHKWFADFQHRYYPDYFSKEEYKAMDEGVVKIYENNYNLVLSSNDCFTDYLKFYYNAANKVNVLQFTTFLPVLKDENFPELVSRFGISEPYFIICNQFWPHKNHITVFRAVKFLKDKGINIQVFCTGHISTHRGDSYTTNLNNFLDEHKLRDCIGILGFLSREDQLLLMKNSIAIVQPTLFEGWSTVVEDAKALNKHIILSSIRVNKEQISSNFTFFEPNDFEELAAHMSYAVENKLPVSFYDYEADQKKYANRIAEIFSLDVMSF